MALDVLEHTNTIHHAFDELCRVARRHVIIALPNQYEIHDRWLTVRGRNRSGKYGLPSILQAIAIAGCSPSRRHGPSAVIEPARRVGACDEAEMLGPRRRRIETLARIWPSLLAPDLLTHLVPLA